MKKVGFALDLSIFQKKIPVYDILYFVYICPT